MLKNTTSELPKNPTAHSKNHTPSYNYTPKKHQAPWMINVWPFLLSTFPKNVLAAFGSKQKVDPTQAHIWQNKNSNDTKDHVTGSLPFPEIEFENFVVDVVAVVTGNSGKPLEPSIFR